VAAAESRDAAALTAAPRPAEGRWGRARKPEFPPWIKDLSLLDHVMNFYWLLIVHKKPEVEIINAEGGTKTFILLNHETRPGLFMRRDIRKTPGNLSSEYFLYCDVILSSTA